MKAFVLHGFGELDQLRWHTDWPDPVPGDKEVLIKVSACGLNNTDVNTRTGWYSSSVSTATTGGVLEDARADDATWGGAPLSLPRIQGADVVGTVVAAGAAVPAARLEQLQSSRVLVDTWVRDHDNPNASLFDCGYFGSECDGGFAEYTAVDYRQVHAVESSYTDAGLATFATSYVTAENMLNRANVVASDTVLITGASGGVGSALVQLVKRRGGIAIAVCSAAKSSQLLDLGADAILPRDSTDWGQALQAAGFNSVSVLADVVGGAAWQQQINLLSRGGRYTCAGAIAGPIVDFDLRTFYLKDLVFSGATVVPAGVFADLVGYIEREEIKPLLAAQFPLSELHQAQTEFINKQHVGNIVVEI